MNRCLWILKDEIHILHDGIDVTNLDINVDNTQKIGIDSF